MRWKKIQNKEDRRKRKVSTQNNKNEIKKIRLRWAHNHEMKKKYRIKKIEEKEKVSTQNKKNKKE